jgi:hypothetical protein
MEVYYTHTITPTCGHLPAGALQRIYIHGHITDVFEPMHRYEILNFKNNTWFKTHIIY